MTEIIFPWRVELFGGLSARQNEIVVSKFQTKKTGALLGFLALGDGKSFPREKICEAIWGSGEAAALRNRLNQAVSTLRRQLETPGASAARIFVSDHHSLGVSPDIVTTDVHEFEDLVRSSRKSHDSATKSKLLERAAELYRGELLEGYDDDWILPHRKRLATEAYEVLRDLVKLKAASGDNASATEYAQRAVDTHPGDEQAHTDLMSLLIAADRHQAAARQYEILEAELAKQGRSPSILAASLREQATSQQPPTVVEPGKGEAVVELPTVPTPAPGQHSRLPIPFNRIVGRESELATLKRMLLEDRAKVVTVVGMGGSGKSRLVIELASLVEHEYVGRVFFVPLLPFEHHTDIIDQVCSVVCPSSPPERRNLPNLVDSLANVERCLFVLDAADHIDDATLRSIAEMISKVSGLQLLVTSRQSLHIAGAVDFTIGPLAVPDPQETDPAIVAATPSVQLFTMRAQTVKPDFQVTERSAKSIANLCNRLEGLPLSLELAAGWARSLSPAQMSERLGQRMVFLASRRRDISERHRTFRAVLDSTMAVLPPELTDAFFRLSVFANGFTHETATRVCPNVDIAHTIQDLLEACLVQPSSDIPDATRFAMLETLREYAREQASKEILAESGRLHAECFFELAVSEGSDRFASPDEWMLAIIADYGNVVGAMSWFMDNGQTDRTETMATCLVDFWEASGSLREGISWLEASLKTPQKSKSTKVQCLAGLSRLTWHSGDRVRARNLIKQSLADAYASNDDKALQEVLLLHQLDEHNQGNLDEAERIALEGIQISERLQDVSTQARWFLRLGNVSMEKRDWPKARERYEKCLELGRKIGDSTRIASALVNLGHYGIKTGQPEFAKLSLLEALEQKRSTEFRFTYGTALANLARAECLAGKPDQALAWLDEALGFHSEDQYVVRDILSASALVAARIKESEIAATLLGHTRMMLFGNDVQGLEAEARAEIEAEARSAIGDKRFDERFLFGRQLSTNDAVKLATKMARCQTSYAEDKANAPT